MVERNRFVNNALRRAASKQGPDHGGEPRKQRPQQECPSSFTCGIVRKSCNRAVEEANCVCCSLRGGTIKPPCRSNPRDASVWVGQFDVPARCMQDVALPKGLQLRVELPFREECEVAPVRLEDPTVGTERINVLHRTVSGIGVAAPALRITVASAGIFWIRPCESTRRRTVHSGYGVVKSGLLIPHFAGKPLRQCGVRKMRKAEPGPSRPRIAEVLFRGNPIVLT